MIKPTLAEAKLLCEGNTVIPIAMEMLSDVRTPLQVLRTMQSKCDRFYMLESVESGDSWGRYTFMGYLPSLSVYGIDGEVTISENGNTRRLRKPPGEVINEILAGYRSPHIDYLPPFTGGLTGYFSYEYIKYAEKTLTLSSENENGFFDFYLMLFDKVIAFDHFKQKIYLIVNVKTDNIENNYVHGVMALKDMERLVLSPEVSEDSTTSCVSGFKPMFSKEEYCQMVERTKEYIYEGDIFQAVISNRMESSFSGSLLGAYRILRTINPSPYMFYINFGELEVAGASPETLIALKDGVLNTYPLAGTCKRGDSPAEDKKLIDALLQNEKELAEHDMLVDLGRNDLGKICKFGTVEVSEYRNVKKFSHVCHIASRVTGIIDDGYGPMDAIMAALPAGTLSGAPKKRACEIISSLEKSTRGVYGGAIGYIDFTGNMDMCIGIRMMVAKDGKVFVQSGAGIVADSIPENEYEEINNKAKGMMEALTAAQSSGSADCLNMQFKDGGME